MSKTPSTFFGQLIARLGSETPDFFKKIIVFGASLLTTGVALLGLKEGNVHIPEIIYTLASYMVTAGTVISVVAKAATTNPDLQAKGGAIPKAAVDAVKDANADEIKK